MSISQVLGSFFLFRFLSNFSSVYIIDEANFSGVNLVEMPRSKKTSFCWGAGGAQMFKEPESGNQDININRTEEALKTNAEIIITGCPFCNTMMTDGVKNLAEGSVEVLDIVEMIKIKDVSWF